MSNLIISLVASAVVLALVGSFGIAAGTFVGSVVVIRLFS
jgi:hypothetical protein